MIIESPRTIRCLACFCLLTIASLCQRPIVRADEVWAGQPPPLGTRDRWQQLNRDGTLWIDLQHKSVAVRGEIVLREGMLEMFACPRGTKEHESIVAVQARAADIHAALLAAGLQPGTPVAFDPEYQAAAGPQVEVQVAWREGDQLRRSVAQQWIRDVCAQAEMKYDWVFAGSGFWTDDETGERVYFADGGELICVSNFSTAMLDLPVPSPEQNSDLWFEPWTDRIPPLGTEVWLRLREKPQ